MSDRDLGDRWSTAIAALAGLAIARYSRAHQKTAQPNGGLDRSSAQKDNSGDDRVELIELPKADASKIPTGAAISCSS